MTLIGVCLDKFVVTFPWTGIKTIVGDLNVDVSKDWEVQDSIARRVAGFTRSSICVAVFLPMLTMVIMSRRLKSWLPRFILRGGRFRRGAADYAEGGDRRLCPDRRHPVPARTDAPRFAAVEGVPRPFQVALAVAILLLAAGLHMDHGTGVFSTESIYLRIAYTWPQAWIGSPATRCLICRKIGLGGRAAAALRLGQLQPGR